MRRISFTNIGRSTREIELTTYAEVVLADPAADSAHPAFSKMFVQTEFVAESGARCSRRAAAASPAKRRSGCFTSALGRRSRRRAAIRDRPGTVPRQGRRPAQRGVHPRCSPAVRHRRHRARSGARAEAPRAHRARAKLRGSTSGPVSRRAAPRRLLLPANYRDVGGIRPHQAAGRGAGARRARASSRWTWTKRADFSALPIECCTPTARCAPRARFWRAIESGPSRPVGLRNFRRSAHRAGADRDDGGIAIVKQLLRAHEYWRLKRLAVDLVILNDLPAVGAPNWSRRWRRSGDIARARGRRASSAAACSRLRSDTLPAVAAGAFADRGARDIRATAPVRSSDQLAGCANRARAATARRTRRDPAFDAPRNSRRSNSSTASAASPLRGASTSRSSRKANGRPRPGSTSSRIRISDFSYRRMEPAARGRSMRSKIS